MLKQPRSETSALSDPAVCPECETRLVGEYCHGCGQRRLRPEDRRMGHLLGEALASLTSLEGRWLRSLGLLVVDTGALSRAWLVGRRQRYPRPVSLFLLVNLVFFVAPPMTDFDLHLDDHLGQPFYGEWARSRVEARLAAEGVSYDEFTERFARASSNVAKSLVVLHVPVIAWFLFLAAAGRRWTYAEHVVVALHLFAFLLLAAQILNWIVFPVLAAGLAVLPGGAAARPPIGLVALAILVVGWGRGLRVAYAMGAARAGVALLAACLGLAVAHLLYRAVQFALVSALI